ncbi:response regulator [Elusimicrobiota bacterium]
MNKKTNILVIDDDIAILDIIKRIIEKLEMNCSVTTALNGLEAILAADKSPPALLIIDIFLPWLDGFKLIQLFSKKFPSSHILAISGKSSPEISENAIDAGADEFLSKPFKFAELQDTVKELLGRKDLGKILSSKRTNIFLVEDHYAQLLYLKETVESLGYNVVGGAQTGEDAVKKALDIKPDIILMDIELHGKMNGIQAAETILKELSLPIVFISASDENDHIEKAVSLCATAFITKPFSKKDLKFSIEKALYERETGSQ